MELTLELKQQLAAIQAAKLSPEEEVWCRGQMPTGYGVGVGTKGDSGLLGAKHQVADHLS